MSEAPTIDEVASALRAAGLSPDPARFHGALCGTLCQRDAANIDPLSLLAEERAPVEADAGEQGAATLRQLRDRVAEALDEGASELELLLPNDHSVSLQQRTSALAAWCDGFLFGLASGGSLDLDKASEEVREAVSDITQFTRATIEGGDDLETEEGAYAELVEYLRVVVQLIHIECRKATGDAAPRMH